MLPDDSGFGPPGTTPSVSPPSSSSPSAASGPFVTSGPDDDPLATSGNPSTPSEEAAEMPLTELDAAKVALCNADYDNQPCTLNLVETRAVLACLLQEPEASASSSSTSNEDSTAPLEFLCRPTVEMPSLGVGPGPYGNTPDACVNHLREAGLNVTPVMARLAIRIYTERNEACHAKVGNPSIAGNSSTLLGAIVQNIEKLSQVLPEDQVENRKTFEQLMYFYRDSASWLANKDDDRLEDHRESRTPRLPPPEDTSSAFRPRSVSPSKRTVSGSSKSAPHLPTSSEFSTSEEEGLHAFHGIREDLMQLESKGGDKAIQAVQEARKLLRQALEVTTQEEKAAAIELPQQKKRRYKS